MTITTVLLIIMSISLSWSQTQVDQIDSRNEIKINGLHILLESFEISYDYLTGDQSSVGVSLAAALNDDIGFDFMVMPNYKLFFNEKKAAGFYIELNSAIIKDESEANFGVGIAIGGKFLNKKNFIGEIVVGGGRILNNDGGYPRFGISIGKRF